MELSLNNSTQDSIEQREALLDELPESFAQRMFSAALTFDKYYTPLLFLFGTLGNSLSVTVFCMNAKYRSQSASYYLSALAISDTGFLINLLAVWLETVHGGIITSGIMCPLVMYLGQVTCFMSVYLTVAFSIERYVAVHYPLSRPRICTRSKARKVIAALTAVALLVFSYAWVIAQVIELPLHREDYDDNYHEDIATTETTNNLNVSSSLFSEQNSQELSSFPDFKLGKAHILVKRESFRESLLSPQFPTPYKQLIFNYKMNPNPAYEGNVQQPRQINDCGNQTFNSHTFTNLSSSFLIAQNEFRRIGSGCKRNKLHFQTFQSFYSDGLSIYKRHGLDNFHEESSSTSEITANGYEIGSVTDKTVMMMIKTDVNSEEEPEPISEFLSGGFICSVPKDYYRISEIANYLDSVVTLIIPFVLITFFNVRIAICVWKLRDQRQNIVASSFPSTTTTGRTASSADINNHHFTNSSNNGLRCSTNQRNPHFPNNRHHNHRLSVENEKYEKSPTSGNGIIRQSDNHHPPPSNHRKGIIKFQHNHNSENLSSHKFEVSGKSIANGANDCSTSSSLSSSSSSSSERNRNENDAISPRKDRKSPNSEGVKPEKVYERSMSSSATGSISKGLRIKWEQDGESRLPPQGKVELSFIKERLPVPSSSAAEARVTKTLLLVSSVFLVLNLPAHAIRCALFIQSLRGTSEGNEFLHAAQPWTNILFNTNFAVNFLLYCVSGRNFRKSLKNIILRKFSRNSAGTSGFGFGHSTANHQWQPVKSSFRTGNPSSSTKHFLSGKQSNCTWNRDLQTEIIELEDRREEQTSIFPLNLPETPVENPENIFPQEQQQKQT